MLNGPVILIRQLRRPELKGYFGELACEARAPEGTLISFATQPGSVALDGIDGHGPFTSALARTIRKPGLGIFDAMNEVGLAVKHATGGSQQPWFSTSPIGGSFYFATAPSGTQAPSSTTTPTAVSPRVTVVPPIPKPTRIANAPRPEAPPKPPMPSAASPPAPAGANQTGPLILPKEVSPKYASEDRGQARMHTCLEQYIANKETNGNGGMKWIEKGGGYYSACNNNLK
jgi:hypothetical protein